MRNALKPATVSQGTSVEEAIANLKEATELYLEEFPISEVRRFLVTTFEVTHVQTAPCLRRGGNQGSERLGFVQVRQPGNHMILKKQTAEGTVGCAVPLHRELAIGTLRGILKLARMHPDEFMESL